MFTVAFTPSAMDDLRALSPSDQRTLVSAVHEQLRHQPHVQTRNRKQLRPNPISSWELRVGELRAFYNVFVEERRVDVVAVGWKEGNRLFVRGEEREL